MARHEIKKDFIPRRIKHTKPYQEKEYLIREHINNHKSIAQLSRENNVSDDAIMHFIKKYEIPYWTETNKTKYTKEQEQEVCDLYINQHKSAYQIEQELNICHGIVKNILIRNGYKPRNMQEAQFNYFNKEINSIYLSAEALNDLYWTCGFNSVEIAELIGVDSGTLRSQMHRFGIPLRDASESKIGILVGERHHNWRGGITELDMLLREFFNVNLAPKAYKRDNYTCQLCGAQNTELHAHHKKHFSQIVNEIISRHPELNVQDNKQELYDIITHDEEFLSIDNLVTYCRDCHLFKIHCFKRNKTISSQAAQAEGSETIEKTEEFVTE